MDWHAHRTARDVHGQESAPHKSLHASCDRKSECQLPTCAGVTLRMARTELRLPAAAAAAMAPQAGAFISRHLTRRSTAWPICRGVLDMLQQQPLLLCAANRGIAAHACSRGAVSRAGDQSLLSSSVWLRGRCRVNREVLTEDLPVPAVPNFGVSLEGESTFWPVTAAGPQMRQGSVEIGFACAGPKRGLAATAAASPAARPAELRAAEPASAAEAALPAAQPAALPAAELASTGAAATSAAGAEPLPPAKAAAQAVPVEQIVPAGALPPRQALWVRPIPRITVRTRQKKQQALQQQLHQQRRRRPHVHARPAAGSSPQQQGPESALPDAPAGQMGEEGGGLVSASAADVAGGSSGSAQAPSLASDAAGAVPGNGQLQLESAAPASGQAGAWAAMDNRQQLRSKPEPRANASAVSACLRPAARMAWKVCPALPLK